MCVLGVLIFKYTLVPSWQNTPAPTQPQSQKPTPSTLNNQSSIDWQTIQIDKVRVYKSKRFLEVLQNDQVIKSYPIRLGFNPIGHKTTEGDGKTPEGLYTLDWRNPNSQFYKSLHISYPNADDIAQAKARGVSAGSAIMIHGSPNSLNATPTTELYDKLLPKDWTHGCIAVSNQDMDELWENITDGTAIEILP